MPTYEFSCGNCGHRFEEFLPISSGHSIDCPLCGRESRKMISGGIGLIFKGSGFYVTDYRKPENGAKQKVEE
jgi:putative FmdB family regulatory protein